MGEVRVWQRDRKLASGCVQVRKGREGKREQVKEREAQGREHVQGSGVRRRARQQAGRAPRIHPLPHPSPTWQPPYKSAAPGSLSLDRAHLRKQPHWVPVVSVGSRASEGNRRQLLQGAAGKIGGAGKKGGHQRARWRAHSANSRLLV